MGNYRILHLLSSKIFTDIENTIVQSIDFLKNDCEIAYASPTGPISRILRKKEINYLPLENMDLKSISNIIKTFAPNVIHAHDFKACILASKFSKDIKIIAHLHEDTESFHKFSKESLLFKSASKHFTKIIWPSEEMFKNYKYSKSLIEKSVFLRKAINCEDVIKKSTLSEKDVPNFFDILLFYDKINDELFMKFINIMGLLKGRGFSFKCGVISSFPLAESFSSYIKECRIR
ncbi:MAG: hypothetical protein IJX99_01710 [Clostridia bacterium]|nr:hypothetical protein [Clostridia bacterium]